MGDLKGALECVKDSIDSAYQEPKANPRMLHTLQALHYLYEAVKSLEEWQSMLLELHKAREPFPGEVP